MFCKLKLQSKIFSMRSCFAPVFWVWLHTYPLILGWRAKCFDCCCDKADRCAGIRVLGLGGDINQVAELWEAAVGTLSHSSPVQTLHSVLRLGCCNAGGAQHSSLHPSYVTSVDWMGSENTGTRWWGIYFSMGGREFVYRVRIGSG